ncbi:unnamed protein product [Danaus chrysippus]|uniref:(African queen) hypothetical protein n=1 Tax=Danaus chrysippus TaxID=151541 RepID=A0A8J2QRG3_9NEOP|nr:unnamed protein product [Danaus chrysippus]
MRTAPPGGSSAALAHAISSCLSDWLGSVALAPPRRCVWCVYKLWARTQAQPIPYQFGLTSNGPRSYRPGARGNVALKDNVSDAISV